MDSTRALQDIIGFSNSERNTVIQSMKSYVYTVIPRSIEGLESSRPSESLKAAKSRPHQVRISNPQKTSQSESVGPMPPSY